MEERELLLNFQAKLWKVQNNLWRRQNQLIKKWEYIDPLLPPLLERIKPLKFKDDNLTKIEQLEYIIHFLIKIRHIWLGFLENVSKYLSCPESPVLIEVKKKIGDSNLPELEKIIEKYFFELNKNDVEIELLNRMFDLKMSKLLTQPVYDELWHKYCPPVGRYSIIEMIGPSWVEFLPSVEYYTELNQTNANIKIYKNGIKYYIDDEQLLFLRYLKDFPMDRFKKCKNNSCNKIFVATRIGREYCSNSCRQQRYYYENYKLKPI